MYESLEKLIEHASKIALELYPEEIVPCYDTGTAYDGNLEKREGCKWGYVEALKYDLVKRK